MTRRDRRRVLELLAASAWLPACTPRTPAPPGAEYAPGQPLPWINWAGNQICHPRQRLAPASEDELAAMLRRAGGTVRAAGASHSFAALVPTDDTLIATDLLSGLIGHDAATHQAELWAGTRLHDTGPLLEGVGQALPNMPDMDYPALGGAIATSAHATGPRFGSLSSYVMGLTLVTPGGQVISCSATEHSAIFQAARTSLGALGIVSRIRLQNQQAFQLTEVNRVERTEDVLAGLKARSLRHRHFEFLPLPHSDLCLTVATDPATTGDQDAGQEDPQALIDLRKLFNAVNWLPGSQAIYDRMLTILMGDAASVVRTGPSYRVFPHPRVVRFREMEYMVPADAGPDCIREILRTIRERKIPVCFPLEYRQVAADDIWLSMFRGRASACIAVHQFGDVDYRPYFAEIEPIFWKYEGRPHWGKLHTLDAARLAALYGSHWQDFQEVRRTLDPQGKMLNRHLKTLFGV
ncbi:FAD-binding protein [Duganella sp. FT92W]|uniref:FAD-binding protein n=1 Tax=Pseudoduganella rivuli TaxID=2666085 RepID=A0A7X2IJ01_9BURK|nr:D-arabinono-1,4-lactone oxidase [Pseudoduganella rivuli]MRV70432.1 FAD-binding protein [Pseudoduganella rivuli]